MVRAIIGLVLALVLTGCASSSDDDGDTAHVDTSTLHASLTQHRYDEGTHDLLAGITNDSGHEVRISRATVRWDGLDFPPATIEDPAIPPGETAAFTATYGEPRCDEHGFARPTLVAEIDGAKVTLPLHVDMPGLLEQLRAKACDEQALDRLASVSLRWSRRTTSLGGTEVLPGQVVVRRRTGRTGTVTVDDLGGSVLFAVQPAPGTSLPARMGPDQQRLVVPVVVRSAGRCDPHSRSQSSQTFLFSVFAHRGSGDPQRLVRFPSAAEQQRLLGMLDRVCG